MNWTVKNMKMQKGLRRGHLAGLWYEKGKRWAMQRHQGNSCERSKGPPGGQREEKVGEVC